MERRNGRNRRSGRAREGGTLVERREGRKDGNGMCGQPLAAWLLRQVGVEKSLSARRVSVCATTNPSILAATPSVDSKRAKASFPGARAGNCCKKARASQAVPCLKIAIDTFPPKFCIRQLPLCYGCQRRKFIFFTNRPPSSNWAADSNSILFKISLLAAFVAEPTPFRRGTPADALDNQESTSVQTTSRDCKCGQAFHRDELEEVVRAR